MDAKSFRELSALQLNDFISTFNSRGELRPFERLADFFSRPGYWRTIAWFFSNQLKWFGSTGLIPARCIALFNYINTAAKTLDLQSLRNYPLLTNHQVHQNLKKWLPCLHAHCRCAICSHSKGVGGCHWIGSFGHTTVHDQATCRLWRRVKGLLSLNNV